jgi:hypothetical protein
MSGEFGEYGTGGYHHRKVSSAHEDLLDGTLHPTSQAWAPVYDLMAQVARAISWHEACDSGEGALDLETDRLIPLLIAELEAMREARAGKGVG